MIYASLFSTGPNASYHGSIIVDEKCPQFVYTMALGSAMLIPNSNLTDPSTFFQTNTSLSLSFCLFISTCIKLSRCNSFYFFTNLIHLVFFIIFAYLSLHVSDQSVHHQEDQMLNYTSSFWRLSLCR